MGNIYAIGDIHGRKDLLDLLLDKLRHQGLDLTVDKLIFLGDMVDRGSDSKGVIATVRDLCNSSPNVIALRGNHEDMMLAAETRSKIHAQELWFANGGIQTLLSYRPLSGVSEDDLRWVASLPHSHEEPGFFFSHAPVPLEEYRHSSNKGKPFTVTELTWHYDPDEEGSSHRFADGKVGVCGHVHRLFLDVKTPRLYDHYIFTDSGCGCSDDAPLSAVEVTGRSVIMAAPSELDAPKKTLIIQTETTSADQSEGQTS